MNSVREQLHELDGIRYLVRPLNYGQKKDVRNAGAEIVSVEDPITRQVARVERTLTGDYQARTIFAGLKSWSIVDGDKPVLLNWDNFLKCFNRRPDAKNETVTLDKTDDGPGITYELRPLTYPEKIAVKNLINETAVEKDPITGQLRAVQRFRQGDFNARMIFTSLVSWSVTDDEGAAVPLTYENFLERFREEHENRLLEVVFRLTPDHDEVLFASISKLSSLSDDEKKTS